MLRELEIAAFAADFGADQNACPFRIGKGGGVAVPLHEIEAFVEKNGMHVDLAQQALVDVFGEFARAADEQDFGLAKLTQRGGKPADERVFGSRIWLDAKQPGMALAGRESLDDGTGVPKHDATGAKFVEQVANEALAGGFIACAEFGDVLLDAWGVAGEEFAVFFAHAAALQDAIHHLRDLLVAGLIRRGSRSDRRSDRDRAGGGGRSDLRRRVAAAWR